MSILRAMLLISIFLPVPSALPANKMDVAGTWEIQEEERSYVATLDQAGNGTYTWQEGRITTTELSDGIWRGVWQQPGNDREGGFEVVLAPDGTTAHGKWWYTRVGRQNIPSGEWGGDFTWKRVVP